MKQKIGTAVGFIGSAALVALLVGIHFVFRYNLYSLFGMAALFLEISSFICTGMFVGLTARQYFSASPRAFMIAKYAVGIVFLALAALGSQLCYGDLTPLFCIALAALVVCCVAESVCSHGGVPVRPRKGVGAAVLAAVVLFAGAAVLAGVHGPMKYAAALEAHQKTVEAETPSVENYCELLAGMPEDTVLKVTVSGDGGERTGGVTAEELLSMLGNCGAEACGYRSAGGVRIEIDGSDRFFNLTVYPYADYLVCESDRALSERTMYYAVDGLVFLPLLGE